VFALNVQLVALPAQVTLMQLALPLLITIIWHQVSSLNVLLIARSAQEHRPLLPNAQLLCLVIGRIQQILSSLLVEVLDAQSAQMTLQPHAQPLLLVTTWQQMAPPLLVPVRLSAQFAQVLHAQPLLLVLTWLQVPPLIALMIVLRPALPLPHLLAQKAP
jgi:hypothetical protein